MPGLSGSELAREIKNSGWMVFESLPKLVLCSADMVTNYAELGFDYFLVKPIEIEKLKAICMREGCKMRAYI